MRIHKTLAGSARVLSVSYKYLFTATISSTQAARKETPPIGVIAPSTLICNQQACCVEHLILYSFSPCIQVLCRYSSVKHMCSESSQGNRKECADRPNCNKKLHYVYPHYHLLFIRLLPVFRSPARSLHWHPLFSSAFRQPLAKLFQGPYTPPS